MGRRGGKAARSISQVPSERGEIVKTVVLLRKGVAALLEKERPDCVPDTMLLKTIYSGLSNGTERNQLMGGNYCTGGYPRTPGYQSVSRVVERGSQVSRFEVGDILITGTQRAHSEYYTIRETDLAAKLPEGFDLEEASLLSVASVSYHDAKRAGVTADDRVLVFGAGLIGQFTVQACRYFGGEVTVTDPHPERLALARELGASRTVVARAPDTDERLYEHKPYSVVFECSGADVLDRIVGTTWAGGLLGERGRLVMIAGRREVTYICNAAQGREIAILHASHFEQKDLDEVIKHVQAGRIRIRPLIRDVVPIEDAVRIYETLRDHRSRLMGTVFKWENGDGSD